MGVEAAWFTLRLEFHPKLRTAPSEWKRLSFFEIVQRHVLLDKLDALEAELHEKTGS